MKRKLLLMAILICGFFTVSAQGIEIAFALPYGNDLLSNNTAKMLRSKLLPAMTENGVETTEVSTIAIKPEISFVNRQVVEGGMRNIHTSSISSARILLQARLLQVAFLQCEEKDSAMMTL